MPQIPGDVEIGDRLLAPEWNEILSLLRALKLDTGPRSNLLPTPGGTSIVAAPERDMGYPATEAVAFNNGNNTLEEYRPAGIIGQAYTLTADRLAERCVLNVQDPQDLEDDYEGRYVICLESIPSKKTGRVWVAGVCLAYIVAESADMLLVSLAGKHNYLTAGGSGSSTLIWVASGSAGEQLGMIRLGTAGALGTIPVLNKSGEVAPQGAFVETYKHDGARFWFRKPTEDNADNIYILVEELESEAPGSAWERGITGKAYMLASPSPGNYLGSINGEWYGHITTEGGFVATAPEWVTL